MNHEWLSEWFQPHLLSPERVTESRKAFRDNPARFLVLDDVLKGSVVSSIGPFLEHEAPFKPSFGLFSDGRVDETSWLAAEEEDRFFRYEILGEGPPKGGPTLDLFEFLNFREMIQDKRFGDFITDMTGLQLGQAGQTVHAMREGDFLKPHNDHNEDRVLAFIFYLSIDWKEEYGGSLEICDYSDTIYQVSARANRLVIFDVLAHGQHWVTPVTKEAEGRPRICLAGFFSKVE